MSAEIVTDANGRRWFVNEMPLPEWMRHAPPVPREQLPGGHCDTPKT